MITTIHKPGKSPHDPANYRPISLFNTDLKLYSKLLATRLATYMPTLVQTDQVGFIHSRQASDGTCRFIDMIHWAEHYQMPSLLISLDAEKAFDRVNWLYLDLVLQKFGIHGPFRQAILGLYSGPNTKVLTSGILSSPFPITNGTRQGCPLSPLMFALVIEPLAQAIRAHTDIAGLTVNQFAHKIGLYADDIIIWLTDPLHSLSAAL